MAFNDNLESVWTANWHQQK